ncbi:MAG: TonB-dependent receptor [Prevotella sp.]|nr:TonB-dependent receptor [Prevotella sp.]
MNKRVIFLMAVLLSLCTHLTAQVSVKGNVKDNTGEPIIGASVIVTGTSNGTVTDFDGNFQLKANEGDELTISYIGFIAQKAKVKGTTSINITLLEDNAELDEVVVVGTIMKKSDLTGAVGSVDGKTLTEKPVTNVNQALQGRVSGVFVSPGARPSDDSGIRVRGMNTINSGSDPIYVVDGMVMNNDFGGFSSINPNDVEHLEVLKDASATALYGSRGANGVVLITTKKGASTGVAKGGSHDGNVTYDGWISISSMTQRPKTMNATDLANLRIDAFANGYLRNNPSANREEYINSTLLGTNLAFSEQEFQSRNGNRWNSYDWLDQVIRTGVQHNHNVSFSKAFDKGSVYFSLNYSNLKGIVKGSDQDKYSGRFNAEYFVKSWLKVGTNTSFTRTQDAIPSDDVYNKALSANPILDYAPYMDPATRYQSQYLTVYYQALTENYNNEYNPFNSMDVQRDRTRTRFASSNFININPMKGLNFRSTLSVDYATQSWLAYTPGNIQESVRHESGDAIAQHERWEQSNWQWDNSLSYDMQIDKHKLNVMVGTSMSKESNNYDLSRGYRFPSDHLGYHELAGAAAFEKTVIDSDFRNSTLLSYILRGNYNYDSRYFLTATARYDGSSKFGDGHRWGIFPSFSFAWEATNEKFMQNQNTFSRLKLRLGYGVVGNQDIANYVYGTWYNPVAQRQTIDGNTVGMAGYASSGMRGTPAITWEKQKQFNIGVDFGFMKNRITASADLFYIVNDNLLMQHSLPLTTGYSTTWENIGKVENKGIELSVNARIIDLKDFGWNFGGNISYDANKVTKLYGDVEQILNGTEREGNIFLNEPLHTIYTYRAGGIANESNRAEWEGKNYNGHTVEIGDLFVKDISGPDGKPDGIINEYDRDIVGKSDPKVYGGFNTDFRYKNFTLNAIFTYAFGAKKISDYYESLTNSVGLSQASPDLADRWSATNIDAKFPKVVSNSSGYNGYKPSDTDLVVQNANYLRLSTLTLAYNVDRNVINKLHLSSLRLYATASNLFCLTPYKGFDPETGDYNYPPTKTFTFGLNVSF